jgi:hypothetical protein
MTRYRNVAVCADRPETRAGTDPTATQAGPYGSVCVRHSGDAARVPGSPGYVEGGTR